jgi:hypothetical protein
MTSACCDAAGGRETPTRLRRAREVAAWVVPSAILVLVPKCPACLAAHVALWTGLGLSLSAAACLRWVPKEGCGCPEKKRATCRGKQVAGGGFGIWVQGGS